MHVVPKNFEEWKVCIEEKCGILLTVEFAKQRLGVYENEVLAETQRFIRLYGEEHFHHIKDWFRRIIREKGG